MDARLRPDRIDDRLRMLRLRALPSPDEDGDGLTAYEEHLLRTSDQLADTDGDGTQDEDEFLAGSLLAAGPIPVTPTAAAAALETGTPFMTLSGFGVPGSTIQVTGGELPVTAVTAGIFGDYFIDVPLRPNEINQLSVTDNSRLGGVQSEAISLDILQDSEPPELSIDSPVEDEETFDDRIVVTGGVSDRLSGLDDLAVTVNGRMASITRNIGPNGAYELDNLRLSLGENTVRVVAVDRHGNEAMAERVITRLRPPVVQTERIELSSGQRQTGTVRELLPQPVVIFLRNPDGSAFANKVVDFQVTQSDGLLYPTAGGDGEGSDLLQVRTDNLGRAQAYWRLGSDVGRSNNQLTVSSVGIQGSHRVYANANAGQPQQINVNSGNNQRGPAGGKALEPLRAWVSDGFNPVADVPVTFTAIRGGGRVNGQWRVTVNTNRSGYAEVSLMFGQGQGTNIVEATFPDNPSSAATFTAVGLRGKADQPTAYRGIVFDNGNQPLGGATISIESGGVTHPVTVRSDALGMFELTNIPSGVGHLHVDGSTIDQIGGQPNENPKRIYPPLTYLVQVVPNAANELPAPVYLPRLMPENAFMWDGQSDVTLTVRYVEGLEMLIKAGSMTLADGSNPSPEKPVRLSLDQVHIDNIPMPLPDGTSSLLAWTLQPGGAHFDPPIEVEYPNMSARPPRSRANLLSFDHATERFEIVARCVVTDDGALVKTLPGNGLTISGWGGACPPYADTGDVDGTPEDPTDPTYGTNNGDETEQHTCDQKDSPNTSTGGDPVILSTGELVHTEVDLEIPGRGFPFRLTRTYRSQLNVLGPLGYGWDFSYNKCLLLPGSEARRFLDKDNPDADHITLMNGGARLDIYENDGNGGYTSPRSYYDQLIRNGDGTYTIREPNGFRTTFNEIGKMVSQQDRNGNTMTFHYNDANHLERVIDTLGREIRFTFSRTGRLLDVQDFMGRTVVYTQDAFDDLVSVRSPVVTGTSTGNDFPEGKVTRYAYSTGIARDFVPIRTPSGTDTDTPVWLTLTDIDRRNLFLNHNLISITDPKGQVFLESRYGDDPNSINFDRVVHQRWGEEDQTIDFEYQDINPQANLDSAPEVAKYEVTTIDRNRNRRTVILNAWGNELEERVFTNRNVNPDDPDMFVTRHTYNGDGERTSTIFPEGNEIRYVFDRGNNRRFAQRNVVEITRLPGPRNADQSQITTTFTYEPIYNRVASTTEARGNDANYVPQNGGDSSASRYTTRSFFDYQEGTTLNALALELNTTTTVVQSLLAANGITLGLGDLNEDGATNATRGNVVRLAQPNVRLIDGSIQEIITSTTYNEYGQVTSVTDPEGNVDDYLYHPGNDPDGDGSELLRGQPTGTGGYLFATIKDNRTGPRRTPTAPLTHIRAERYYDPVGNVTRTIDGRGNTTILEVNALNQVVKQIAEAPFFFEEQWHFDANDNVIRHEKENRGTNGSDLDGSVTTRYEYNIINDSVAKHEEVSTKVTLTTRYGYDANQNLNQVTQPEGNMVFTVFDERDLVYSVERGFGSDVASTRTTTYDGNKNAVIMRDAEDNNGDGQPEQTIVAYDGFDRRVSVLDAEGNRATYTIDPAGNVIREERFGLNGGPSRLSNAETGNVLLKRRDCRFDEHSRRYQCDDQLFSNIAEVGPEGPLCPSDGLVTTQYHFDRNHRLVRETDDNTNSSIYTYDGIDRRTSERDAVGNETDYHYDANDNVISVVETDVSPEGIVPDETFTTTFQYDSLDRQTRTVDNLGNVTAYQYDSRDNIIFTTDAMGNTTSLLWDGLNRKLATVKDLRVGGTGEGDIDTSNPHNPDGRISRLAGWDGNSRLISETDDNGNTTRYGYDALDRRITETFADNTVKRSAFDRDSNLVRFTDQNGSVCLHTYDGLNRLLAKNLTRAEGVLGTTQQTFQYDGLSRRTLATDNNDPDSLDDDSRVEFQYDSLSRLLIEVQNGQHVESRYDGVGRRLALTYPNGRVINYSHDEADRIKTIRDQGGATNIAEYDYLGATRVLERRYANGVKSTYHDGRGQQTGYDSLRREIQTRHENQNGELIAGFRYAYDKAHNRRFEQDLVTDTADVYQYDSSYRLTRTGYATPSFTVAGITTNATTNADTANLGASTELWTLDGVGNWENRTEDGASISYTPNVMNEYEAAGGIVLRHDNNGNLLTDGDLTYSHDSFNRLVRIERRGTLVAIYTYDSTSRRIAKYFPATEIRFYHDNIHCIEERDGADNTLREYVYGIRIDEPLELRSNTSSEYYHSNSLGSIKALSNSIGTITERYDYTAYGKRTIRNTFGAVITESLVENAYFFTARRFDRESKLYCYRLRYYSPRTGRFAQRDPLGYIDGMALFQYARSNSINKTDPLGLACGPSSGCIGYANDYLCNPDCNTRPEQLPGSKCYTSLKSARSHSCPEGHVRKIITVSGQRSEDGRRPSITNPGGISDWDYCWETSSGDFRCQGPISINPDGSKNHSRPEDQITVSGDPHDQGWNYTIYCVQCSSTCMVGE
ncbi:MAG: RHS repeat-associated core domain-containing protein [Pseudomonadota bacterium]